MKTARTVSFVNWKRNGRPQLDTGIPPSQAEERGSIAWTAAGPILKYLGLAIAAGIVWGIPQVAAAQSDMSHYYSRTYRACLDSGENSRVCTSPELKRWDDQLNATYHQLMATLPPERQTALRDAERAWIKKSAATCAQNPDDIEGTMWLDIKYGCELDATIERVLYLRAYR